MRSGSRTEATVQQRYSCAGHWTSQRRSNLLRINGAVDGTLRASLLCMRIAGILFALTIATGCVFDDMEIAPEFDEVTPAQPEQLTAIRGIDSVWFPMLHDQGEVSSCQMSQPAKSMPLESVVITVAAGRRQHGTVQLTKGPGRCRRGFTHRWSVPGRGERGRLLRYPEGVRSRTLHCHRLVRDAVSIHQGDPANTEQSG